ncbi:MAG TPA: pyridoxamine 5'-phosphate oxidase [Anaerolineae bacterium]|jgi:hypothetical protein
MSTKQGDVALLNDPIAQELLLSDVPAHLAYNWTDGTPRVEPIWFHWNGTELVIASPSNAPKSKAIKTGTPVAITIDTYSSPQKVLIIRGVAKVDLVPGVAPEYALAAERYMGKEQGRGWVAGVKQMIGEKGQMFRVSVKPEFVAVLDFVKRFPSAIQKFMA